MVEVPSEGARSAAFAAKVKLNHYPTFEGGGLLWVFLGQGAPPPRPPLPFLDLPADHLFITRSIAPCNWLQGVEGTIDSVHVGTLHRSWMSRPKGDEDSPSQPLSLRNVLRYEVEDTAYGIRAAALRPVGEDREYIRVSEYVMPFTTLVPGSGRRGGSMFIAVPIDNTSHMLFWGLWDEDGRSAYLGAEPGLRTQDRDVDNYALIAGTAGTNGGRTVLPWPWATSPASMAACSTRTWLSKRAWVRLSIDRRSICAPATSPSSAPGGACCGNWKPLKRAIGRSGPAPRYGHSTLSRAPVSPGGSRRWDSSPTGRDDRLQAPTGPSPPGACRAGLIF